jgi:hypothetical protein
MDIGGQAKIYYADFCVSRCVNQMKVKILQKVWCYIVALAWLTPDVSIQAAQAKYDLLIRNGRIVDGTGNPWFYGNVAVSEDRIVSVGPGAKEAKREIDARGLVVAPGFIDMHSHSDWLLLEDGNAQSKIRQGVTTEVIGEGSSAGPFKGKLAVGTYPFETSLGRSGHWAITSLRSSVRAFR